MFSLALVAALAAAQTDPVIPARRAYAACINKTMTAHLEKKDDPGAFDGAIQSACATEAAALRTALVNSDVARGFKRKDAEEGATLQIDDYLAVAKEEYRGYLDNGTRPN